jgi:hypothetical protein
MLSKKTSADGVADNSPAMLSDRYLFMAQGYLPLPFLQIAR